MMKLYNADGTLIPTLNMELPKVIDEPDFVAGTDNVTDKFEIGNAGDIAMHYVMMKSKGYNVPNILGYWQLVLENGTKVSPLRG